MVKPGMSLSIYTEMKGRCLTLPTNLSFFISHTYTIYAYNKNRDMIGKCYLEHELDAQEG